MASVCKTLPSLAPELQITSQLLPSRSALLAQIAISFILLEATLWTRVGLLNLVFACATLMAVFIGTRFSGFTAKQMGLLTPPARSTGRILAVGSGLAMLLSVSAYAIGVDSQPFLPMTVSLVVVYSLWAFLQEFMLQSFFFLRLESLFGSRTAVLAAGLLFSLAHLPNVFLTVATLPIGILFCELFRRFRTLAPIGLIHAVLGLVLAARVSDSLLHHMRVGIGYLLH